MIPSTSKLRVLRYTLCIVLIVLSVVVEVDGRKGTTRRRRFCPSVVGKKRPAILTVEASFDTSKGKAVFRVNTCRDPPVCFIATTKTRKSQDAVESALWQLLLDAVLGKLDIEPTFQFSKSLSPNKENKKKKVSSNIPYFEIPNNLLYIYPVLEKLCSDSYGVYSFVKVKNKSRSRNSSMFSKVQNISQLLAERSANKTRKVSSTGKNVRQPRGQSKKLSLGKLFLNCGPCSRICVQENDKNKRRFLCSTIRVKCSFRCGVLERIMKRQRVKRKRKL